MVEIVDLDLLFKSPQKDARIIGGKGEEASSRESTMEVNFMLKNLKNCWGRSPFYRQNEIWPLGGKTGHSGLRPGQTGTRTDPPGLQAGRPT